MQITAPAVHLARKIEAAGVIAADRDGLKIHALVWHEAVENVSTPAENVPTEGDAAVYDLACIDTGPQHALRDLGCTVGVVEPPALCLTSRIEHKCDENLQ